MVFDKMDNPFTKIVAEFYRVFAYPAPYQQLNVCNCGYCMPSDLEEEMRKLPLREISQRHIYEYITGVTGETERPNEVRYFLPRMVELFTQGEELHHSVEIYFQRVGNCVASFTPTEKALWNQFCMAYLSTLLNIYPYEEPDWQSDNLLNDLFSCLLMFHIGGADIQPFLDFWAKQNTPQYTLNYVANAYPHYWWNRYTTHPVVYEIGNAFAEDYPEYKIMLKNWLDNPQHKAHFTDCLLALSKADIQQFHDEYQDVWVWALGAVDYLFDVLTE